MRCQVGCAVNAHSPEGDQGLLGNLIYIATTEPRSFVGLLGRVLPLNVNARVMRDEATDRASATQWEARPPEGTRLRRASSNTPDPPEWRGSRSNVVS